MICTIALLILKMQMVDFFSKEIFREEPRKDSLFGINDSQSEDGSGMAYTTIANQSSWNATVVNTFKKIIVFEPLDHNIDVRSEDGGQYSLCDGMLFDDDHSNIIFIELKNKGKDWLKKNVGQLESTTKLFTENHEFRHFRRRLAYAVNSRHPQFKYSQKTLMQEFRNKTHFRLLIVALINIE